MLNCKTFAYDLLRKGPERVLAASMFQPRQLAWRARPLGPLLGPERIQRIKWHLKYSFGADPEAFGLPCEPLADPPIVVPDVKQKVDLVAALRKHVRREFVQAQLAKMDEIIAEHREKRRKVRQEQKLQQRLAIIPSLKARPYQPPKK